MQLHYDLVNVLPNTASIQPVGLSSSLLRWIGVLGQQNLFWSFPSTVMDRIGGNLSSKHWDGED